MFNAADLPEHDLCSKTISSNAISLVKPSPRIPSNIILYGSKLRISKLTNFQLSPWSPDCDQYWVVLFPDFM